MFFSRSRKYISVFKQFNLSLIQTTLHSPLTETPLEYHKTFISPPDISASPNRANQSPSRQRLSLSLSLSVRLVNLHKSLKAPLPPSTPLSQHSTSRWWMRLPQCVASGQRSTLTVLVGFFGGRTEVTGTVVGLLGSPAHYAGLFQQRGTKTQMTAHLNLWAFHR